MESTDQEDSSVTIVDNGDTVITRIDDTSNYVHYLPPVTVEEEIFRGRKIRETKPRFYGPHKPLDVVKEETVPCSVKTCRNSKPRQGKTTESRASSPPPCSPFARFSPKGVTKAPASKYSLSYCSRPTTPSTTNKTPVKSKRCPLRIAELAEPSKRHCVETWKDKSSTLPPFMLDRLRQHVKNQKVLATIPDAINCFNRKPKSQSSKKRKSQAEGKYSKNARQTDMVQMRNLCAVFAHSMAKKLIKPMNVSLSEDLEKLSQTVTGEMVNLFGNRNRLYPDYLFDPDILKEMSGKITFWIAGILDDAYYKILEDELRAKKRHENQQGKDGRLVTLIEKYILMQFEERGDLEEEEGPALDALDSLIDNVVNLCIPRSDLISSGDENPDSPPSPSVETDEANSISDTEDKQDRDDSVQSSDKSNEDVTTKSNGDGTIDEEGSLSPKPTLFKMPEQFEDAEGTMANKNEDDVSQHSAAVEIEGTEDQIRDLLNAILTEANLNVSEVFVVVSEEPPDDKRTVKFTADDSGGEKFIDGLSEADLKSSSASQGECDIYFAPPNNHLLSFADEGWPGDIFTPMLKASQSVSKSVISLGKIPEYEETDTYRDSFNFHENERLDKESFDYEEIYPVESLTSEKEKSSKTFENEHKITLKSCESDNEAKSRNDRNKQPMGEQLDINEDRDKQSGKGDHYDTDNESNLILEGIKQKFKQPTNNKFDYKVHPKSAPAWAAHCPSEESLIAISQSRKEISQCELRKWCSDLERTLGNLEQWNEWIDMTCRKIINLKQQTEANNIFLAPDQRKETKAWTKLKKNIDKDAVLWRTLNQRTLKALDTYDVSASAAQFKIRPQSGDPKMQDQSIFYSKDSVFEAIEVVDGLSSLLHRLIVSTEYCVKCNCKNFSKRTPSSKIPISKLATCKMARN